MCVCVRTILPMLRSTSGTTSYLHNYLYLATVYYSTQYPKRIREPPAKNSPASCVNFSPR